MRVGVADARPETAAAGAALVGARAYSSYEDLVAAEDVEVVDVCLPTSYHRELALTAARADQIDDGAILTLEFEGGTVGDGASPP